GRNAGSNDNAVSATVGIKAAGTQGPSRILLAFNGGANAFVGNSKSTVIALPPRDDWYQVTLGPSQGALLVETSTPADGPGEYVNGLDPHVELYSPGGVLLASGTLRPDGRNEFLAGAGLSPGSYRVRVIADGSTSGEYFLGLAPRPSPNIVYVDPTYTTPG